MDARSSAPAHPGKDRFLIGYGHPPSVDDAGVANEAWIGRLRAMGFPVDGICLTIDPPSAPLPWPDLDLAWNSNDPKLAELQHRIKRRLVETGATVFVNYAGINLHPLFVQELGRLCTTVYCGFDDPQRSADISRPVANWYDLAMVGNIAELDMYRSWGCRHVEWLPVGFRADEVDLSVTERSILEQSRPIDLSLFCERISPCRHERLDRLVREFPQGVYRGPGWPGGIAAKEEKIRAMASTRIGFNLHDFGGTVNSRTFTVPANGSMLLCDNSSHLGKVFELGVEAIGYDYMDEAVFNAQFHLHREVRRREIAAAGWLRTMRDYTEESCFRRIVHAVESARFKRMRLVGIATPRPQGLEAVRVQSLDWELDRRRAPEAEILTRGVLDEATTAGMGALVRPGMRWMDIGADIGYLTMLLSKWATEAGRGWAWEPAPELAARLRRHGRINGFSERFTLAETSLGDHGEASGTPSVPLDSVTEVLAEAGFDILRIGLGGREPFFFRGARKFFRKHRPILALEFANLDLTVAGESVFTLVEELRQIGYVPISAKTLEPFSNPLAFLVECGNYAFSAHAWALPEEVLEDFGSLERIMGWLPRSMVEELRVFASTRDFMVFNSLVAGRQRQIRLRVLGGNEVTLRGGTSDTTVLWDVFHFQYHVPPCPLPGESVILDLGANIGLTAAEMAWTHPGARILAVELDPQNAVVAKANTDFLGERCEVVQAGIWTNDGTISYGGVSQQGFSIGLDSGTVGTAPSRRVATLLRERGITKVHYLKMDIEGAELPVLEDSADWIDQVESIKVEIHHVEEYDRIWEILERSGFRCSKERRHYCCIEGVREAAAPKTTRKD